VHFAVAWKERANMGGAPKPIVLVVEDQPQLLLDAVNIGTDVGFEALAASNADAAMRILLSGNDIGVVFTDVQMPGSMDGLELAHAVRQRSPPIKFTVTSSRLCDDCGAEPALRGALY